MGIPRHIATRSVARMVAIAVVLAVAIVLPAPSTAGAAGVDEHDWLGTVNSYRAMSGLDPVVENPTWSQQGTEHSRYMLLNGITHIQSPGNPGYSEGGAIAGSHGNVATSTATNATPRRFIDLWMTGPFHAIGLLRHNLTSSGFGAATDPDTSPWRSAATLDVLRGLTPGIPRSTVTVFPGRDATVPLSRFIAEYPDPVNLVGWSGPAGLPLIALMTGPVSSAAASLTGPDGPIEVRVLHGAAPGSGSGADIAARVMADENAVVVVPRDPLAPGTYTANVTTDAGNVTWSFTVDPTAPLPVAPTAAPAAAPAPTVHPVAGAPTAEPAPDTELLSSPSGFVPASPFRLADTRASKQLLRLEAGRTVSLPIGEPGDVAVSVNVTVDRPAGAGFLSVQGADIDVPIVSTVNFLDRPAANHVVAPIENGRIGIHASVDTDLIIDVNGFFRSDGGFGFVPTEPGRVLDTRAAGQVRLAPGEQRTVPVVGVPGGAPAGAEVVALNLTVVDAAAAGYLTVWPTGLDRVDVSNVNVAAGETRPNSTLVAVGADGTITIESSVHAHLLIDVTGHLVEAGAAGLRFTPVVPIRLLDSRSAAGVINPATDGHRLSAGSSVRIPVAGHRGVPADVRAVWVNVTAVDPARAGYVTVHPGTHPPTTSTLNTHPTTSAVANGSLVALGPDGTLTVHTDHDVHVLVDLTGVWS